MYHLEILLKDPNDATNLPPQDIMERTAKFIAAVLADELGESHVYYGERCGGEVGTNGDIAVERMGAVWAIVDADTFEAAFTLLHVAAACIAEALEQFTVSFMVVDVGGRLHCKPRSHQVALAA